MSNQVLTIIRPGFTTTLSRPDFLATIPALSAVGSDEIKVTLDTDQELVAQRDSAFVVRVSGDGMTASGIHDGDQLIVERNAPVQHSSIVVAVIKGEFTVRRIRKEQARMWVIPENDRHPMQEIVRGSEIEIWGVVTNVIHPVL